MIGKKKRISKKEIKEDKLVSTFYEFQSFFEKNQQYLLIGVGAIALIVVAILWYTNKVEEDNLLAAGDLAKVISLYEQGQYQKAIEGEPGTQLNGLKSIVDNYGSTDQGEIAKIYLANSYYASGDYENALKYYSDYSGDSKLYQATAYAGEAACYEEMGDYKKAAKNYKKAADTYKIDSQTAEYLLNAGINYMKSGNTDEAKKVFELVKKDYKITQASREVDKYLSQLL